jgi:hypothetical protein
VGDVFFLDHPGHETLRAWPIEPRDTARKKMDNDDAQLEAWYNGLVDSPEPDTPEFKQFDWKQGGTQESL